MSFVEFMHMPCTKTLVLLWFNHSARHHVTTNSNTKNVEPQDWKRLIHCRGKY